MRISIYLASILLSLWVFSMITRLIEKDTLPYGTTLFIKQRMTDFLEARDEVFKDPQVALFLGASEVECCVNPSLVNPLFEKHGLNLHAVNIGMRNVEMEVYLAFVFKMVEDLKAQGKTLGTVFVKVPHSKLTQNYFRYSQRTATKADQMAAILSFKDLWTGRNLFADLMPEILANKIFFLGSSPYIYKLLIKNELTEAGILKSEPLSSKYNSLWIEKDFLEIPLWDLKKAGVYNWNLPASMKAYNQAVISKQEHEVKQWSITRLNACCDISNLNVSEKQMQIFIETVNLLKSVSKEVVLYHVPEPPEFLRSKGGDYSGNLQYMFSLIKAGTGIEVLQPVDTGLQDNDYIDILHLANPGQIKFYDKLFADLKRNNMH